MKQVLATTSGVYLDEVPAPNIGPNEVLIQTHFSLISAGTETAGMKASKPGKTSIFTKATNKISSLYHATVKQPQNVAKAIHMLATEGWEKTVFEIKKALGAEGVAGWPTGYSISGKVIKVGAAIKDLKAGDKVAAAGAGKANHAEFVSVPRNLIVKIPEGISMEEASSVTIGSIAMQGVRQASPNLGETVAVLGLGLIGQITVQLLKAAGVKVIGIDLDTHRLETAKKLGADLTVHGTKTNPVKDILRYTKEMGVDSTIITAATKSSIPLQQAMQITRKRGTVVVVGAIGLDLERSPFYQKEINLKISCSYGPGRYDPLYEEKGIDYPYGYVRWTENRNMQAYLNLIADKKLDFKHLIEKTYKIENAANAYQELITAEKKPLAVILKYSQEKNSPITSTVKVTTSRELESKNKINLAVIGAGGFFQGMHLPIIQKLENYFDLHTVWNRVGTKAKEQATFMKFQNASTNYEEILNNKEIDCVFICTRHNTHAEMVIKAIEAKKAVFVEKPLATTQEELERIKTALKKNPVPLLTGLNRRFSPHAKAIKKQLKNRKSPIIVNYRINAGFIPKDHWTQTEEGAGRIIGEACHMFDMFNYFTNSKPTQIQTSTINPKESNFYHHDNLVTTITYEDGSICTLTYTALGSKACPKELCEIFFDGKTMIIDNYKSLKTFDTQGGFESTKTDKGHTEEITQWAKFLKGEQKELPVSLEEQFLATEISFVVEMGTRE